MDADLAMVRDFLAAHEPFSALPAAVLDSLPSRLQARYFRRGSVLVEVGASNAFLFLLRSGAVNIVDSQGTLVERAEVGESFGLSSVMTGGPSAYRLVAHADTLCLLLPRDAFRELMASSSCLQPALPRSAGGADQGGHRPGADARGGLSHPADPGARHRTNGPHHRHAGHECRRRRSGDDTAPRLSPAGDRRRCPGRDPDRPRSSRQDRR
ncbi:cyclic nucleotide-binding domain-containing protein [Propioniciclava flava]